MEKRPNTQNGEETSGKNQNLKFKTQWNPNYLGSPGSVQSDKSETVPDQSLTIRQLVENHSRGINVPINQPKPLYFDSEIPNIQDLTDLDEFKARLKDEKNEVDTVARQELQNAAEARKQAKLDAEILAAHKAQQS